MGYRRRVFALADIMILKGKTDWEVMVLLVDIVTAILTVVAKVD
jgi:hypothetical protein